jgi:hypothetical protein
MITSNEMRDQIRTAVNASDGEYDIDGILAELQEQYGTVDVDSIESAAFWAIVGAYAEV